eukprot:TRINITY_DN15_c0_g1_i5.p1 TRINITY_DN15_c0_g1~~TRINITY_DN15_c0_g1_i5.p1  ORF type:complete len:583 (-),score=130.93 TRINITY_DN15_c0_g1_i5:452-2200(-)
MLTDLVPTHHDSATRADAVTILPTKIYTAITRDEPSSASSSSISTAAHASKIALHGTPCGRLPDPSAVQATIACELSHPIDSADVLAASIASFAALAADALPLSLVSPSDLAAQDLSSVNAPIYHSPEFWNTLPEPDSKVLRARLGPHLDSSAALTQDAPLYAVNLATVYRKYCEWTASIPRVKPFYAVKCNPNRAVVRTLVACGAGFDCASKAEIELCLEMGAPVENIIFANPCKAPPQLRYAKSVSVRTMTFDNTDELHKIARLYPDSELVLRLFTDDAHSSCPLGSKFGAHEDAVPELLQTVVDLNLKLVGISFHVGSGCYDADAYVQAILLARRVFDLAKTFGFTLRLLDIGGGFPGNLSDDEISFGEIARRINPALDDNFGPEVQIIAEPGRYFVSAAFTLAAPIIRKHEELIACAPLTNGPVDFQDNQSDTGSASTISSLSSLESNHASVPTNDTQSSVPSSSPESSRRASFCPAAMRAVYHINDSVYASFKDSILLQIRFTPIPHRSVAPNAPLRSSKLLGNTGEAHDIIHDSLLLPDLNVGDWVLFPNMGAYTVSLSSSFNGCGSHEFVYYWAA